MSYDTTATPVIWVGALDASLGAWLLGTFCGLILFGVLLYQTYQYLRLFPSNPPVLKIWVFSVLIVETLNTVFTVHSSYFYLVTHYNHSIIFNKPPIWTMNSIAITGPLAITISQGFFARRVYILAPRLRGVVYVVTVLLLAFCGRSTPFPGTMRTEFPFKAPNFFAQSLPFSGYVAAGVVCIMAADIQLTTVLIYVLQRSRTGFRRRVYTTTDSLIDILVMYAVTTGIALKFLRCRQRILKLRRLALCFPTTMIYTLFSIALTKLYGNSFLTALNTRQSLIDRGLAGDVVSSAYGAAGTTRPRLSLPVFAHRHLTTPPLLATTSGPSAGTDSRSSAIELKSMRGSSPVIEASNIATTSMGDHKTKAF
ncbi:hypothetical protein C8Q78DRAFT_975087 [Trametes maxima]|nr:hypothetical protein C8Q78DRAFT_975087 [Trametes maxima]